LVFVEEKRKTRLLPETASAALNRAGVHVQHSLGLRVALFLVAAARSQCSLSPKSCGHMEATHQTRHASIKPAMHQNR